MKWVLKIRKNYKNNFAPCFISTICFGAPVALSRAPCLPDFIQESTYFFAFHFSSGGPLMLIIMRLLTFGTSNLFLELVWCRFIWLNPRSHAADEIGRTFSISKKSASFELRLWLQYLYNTKSCWDLSNNYQYKMKCFTKIKN